MKMDLKLNTPNLYTIDGKYIPGVWNRKNLIRGYKNYRTKSRIFAKLDFNIAWNRIPFN